MPTGFYSPVLRQRAMSAPRLTTPSFRPMANQFSRVGQAARSLVPRGGAPQMQLPQLAPPPIFQPMNPKIAGQVLQPGQGGVQSLSALLGQIGGGMSGPAIDPSLYAVNPEDIADINRQRTRATNAKNAAIKQLLLGYGSVELAKKFLDANDPLLATISADPEKSMSFLAQSTKGFNEGNRQIDESSNQPGLNLFFSSARAGNLKENAYQRQLRDSQEATSVNSGIQGAEDTWSQTMFQLAMMQRQLEREAAWAAAMAAAQGGYGGGGGQGQNGQWWWNQNNADVNAQWAGIPPVVPGANYNGGGNPLGYNDPYAYRGAYGTGGSV